MIPPPASGASRCPAGVPLVPAGVPVSLLWLRRGLTKCFPSGKRGRAVSRRCPAGVPLVSQCPAGAKMIVRPIVKSIVRSIVKLIVGSIVRSIE
eukprot:9421098-Pyramimonas_sp.AAC.1